MRNWLGFISEAWPKYSPGFTISIKLYYSTDPQQPCSHKSAQSKFNCESQLPQVQNTQIVVTHLAQYVQTASSTNWPAGSTMVLGWGVLLSSVSFTGLPLEANARFVIKARAKSKNNFFILGMFFNEMPTLFAFRHARLTSWSGFRKSPRLQLVGESPK